MESVRSGVNMSQLESDAGNRSLPPHLPESDGVKDAHSGIELSGETHIGGDLVGGNKIVDHALGDDVVAGDKIVEQDPGDSYDKVLGDKYSNYAVWRIGTFVLPIRFLVAFLAAVLVIAAVSGFILWWNNSLPVMPDHSNNVAIAEFGEIDAKGNIVRSEYGSRLSAWLFQQMSAFMQDKSNMPSDTGVTVWQDSMSVLQKRTNVGLIRTQKEAQDKADEIHADIIFYGNLQPGQALDTFTPLFYINRNRLTQKAGEADELTGPQVFGASFQIQKTLNSSDLYSKLRPRGDAMLWFVRGLGFDLVGDYARAYQTFCQADHVLSDWDDENGREILYYFLGREALFLGNTGEASKMRVLRGGPWWECTYFDSAAQANQEAEKWLTEAQRANSNYGRAFFGLGEVYRQRANNALKTNPTDDSTLNQVRRDLSAAIEQYQMALPKLPDKASGEYNYSYVELKTRAGHGNAYVLMAQSFMLKQEWKPALDNLDLAEQKIAPLLKEDAPPETESRLLAQTNLALGTVEFLRGEVLESQWVDLQNSQSADAPAMEGNAKRSYLNAVAYVNTCLAISDPDTTVDRFLKNQILPNCSKLQTFINGKLATLP